MLHISQLVMKTLLALKKCEIGDQILIRTYKKDRSIVIKKEKDAFQIIEKGFHHQTYENISLEELPKLLRSLKEKEFPRSNQIWFNVQKHVDNP